MNESEFNVNRYSPFTYLSFSMYRVTFSLIAIAQNLFLFFYYHTVVGLDPILIFLAIVITTIWAAFNDPILGYLTDRNFKWTSKWGRRFPWIVIGIIFWPLTFIILFSAPDIKSTNLWSVFWWLMISLLLIDTFRTLVDVNVNMLLPDKFRTENERRKYSSFFGLFEIIATIIAFTIPSLLIGFGTGKMAYIFMAILVALIGLIFGFLFLPGAREDDLIIKRYITNKLERMKFFKGSLEAIKQKSFIAFFIQFVAWGAASSLLTAMVIYVTIFVLRTTVAIMTLLLAIFLLGSLISIPFWLHLVKKYNDNRKIFIIGNLCLCLSLIPITFFQSIVDLALFMFIVGFFMGCGWILGIPVILSNVQDDFVARTGKNQKGFISGLLVFFGVLVAFIDEGLIMIVFNLTGFVAGYDTYEELAKVVPDMTLIIWGIRLLTGVIPMFILLIGTIIFWRLYPLTPEKVRENKIKLEELGL